MVIDVEEVEVEGSNRTAGGPRACDLVTAPVTPSVVDKNLLQFKKMSRSIG